MITDIRLRSQQLVNPAFDDPKELVAWMGACLLYTSMLDDIYKDKRILR